MGPLVQLIPDGRIGCLAGKAAQLLGCLLAHLDTIGQGLMGWHGLPPSRDVDSLSESAGGLDVAHRVLAGVDAHFDVRGGRSGHLPGAVVGYLVSCRPELVGRLDTLLDAPGNRLVRWHSVARSRGLSLRR